MRLLVWWQKVRNTLRFWVMINNGWCIRAVDLIYSCLFEFFMAVVQVACIHCQQTINVVKNGKAETGHQRYRCRDCNKSFQLEYRYNGNLPGTHERIIKMTMNGSGIRDIGRVLEISPTTVLAHLKNSTRQQWQNSPSKIAGSKLSSKWMSSGHLLVARSNNAGCFMHGSRASRRSLPMRSAPEAQKHSKSCWSVWPPSMSLFTAQMTGSHIHPVCQKINISSESTLPSGLSARIWPWELVWNG